MRIPITITTITIGKQLKTYDHEIYECKNDQAEFSRAAHRSRVQLLRCDRAPLWSTLGPRSLRIRILSHALGAWPLGLDHPARLIRPISDSVSIPGREAPTFRTVRKTFRPFYDLAAC